MRFENKFVFDRALYDTVYSRIMQSSFFFTEIFKQRRINNIYLDTAEFTHYYNNMTGIHERQKHRIRWYGDDPNVTGPILEYKIKHGDLGTKSYLNLPPFKLPAFDYGRYVLEIKSFTSPSDDAGQIICHELAMESPSLFNSYLRRYFISNNGRYRITLDDHLEYRPAGRSFLPALGFKDSHIVLELKYENEDAHDAKRIVQELGCRLERNSKYVTGILGVYLNAFSD